MDYMKNVTFFFINFCLHWFAVFFVIHHTHCRFISFFQRNEFWWWIFNFTGADIRLNALHAIQQHIRIYFTQDISNINAFGSFVWCLVDLCQCLLLWHSIQHFYTQRDERKEFKWICAKNITNNNERVAIKFLLSKL